MYDITTYGASTGLSDNAPAINAAISAACSAGGGEVYVPPGTWKVQSQIQLMRNVFLMGGTPNHYWWGNRSTSTIEVDWGVGSSSNPALAAVTLVASSGASKLCFSYPWQSLSSAPVECGATFSWDYREINAKTNITINDCHFDRAYVAADLRGHGPGNNLGCAYLSFTNNTGSPLKHALRINFIVDWCEFSNNSFNSGSCAPAQPITALTTWCINNAVLYEIGRSDWVQLTNCKHWGYFCAFNFDVSGDYYTGSGPFTVNGCETDGCMAGVNIQGKVGALSILNSVFTSFNPTSSTSWWTVGIGGASGVDSFQFCNNYIFGPNAGIVWFGQPDQIIRDVVITGNIARVDPTHANCPVYIASSEKLLACGNIFTGYPSPPVFNSTHYATSGNLL